MKSSQIKVKPVPKSENLRAVKKVEPWKIYLTPEQSEYADI
jgi:hypothetical protein